MRILLTTDTIGGVWTFTKELVEEFLGRGHTVGLVSFGGRPNRDQAAWATRLTASFGEQFRYEASAVALEWMSENSGAYGDAAPELMRIMDTFGPEIFHSSQFCHGALALDLPKLLTAHSDVLSWAAVCRPEGLEGSAWLTRYVEMVQAGLDGCDAVTAPTAWMLQALRENFRVSGRERVTWNGRTIRASNVGDARERKLQAISVGRWWDEAKNLALLTRMAAPMPILIAGEQRQDDCSVTEVPGTLRYLGVLDEAELQRYFCESSLYLVSSIYEPFGLAPLEAALCGCGVVANDLPSLREVWDDSALYFRDASGLEELLQALSGDAAMLARLREASMRRARELTAGRMAEGYLALYEELLQARPTARRTDLAAQMTNVTGQMTSRAAELAGHAG